MNYINSVGESYKSVNNQIVETKNTEFVIENITYNSSNSRLSFDILNTGQTQLSVDDIDILIDGEYHQITGDTIIQSERKQVTITENTAPSSIKIIVGSNIQKRITV
jgi:archaellum component FlaF (FlaF/FlaG flagellin family)